MGDVAGHRRYMHRTTVAGEAPVDYGPTGAAGAVGPGRTK